MSSSCNDKAKPFYIDPMMVYFTFSRIRPFFSCGRPIEATLKQLLEGEVQPEDLPCITLLYRQDEGREEKEGRGAFSSDDQLHEKEGGKKKKNKNKKKSSPQRKEEKSNKDEKDDTTAITYFSLNNRRLFCYKEMKKAGKVDRVPVRLKPMPDTRRMKDKYTKIKCSLAATLMPQHLGEEGKTAGKKDQEEGPPSSSCSSSSSSSFDDEIEMLKKIEESEIRQGEGLQDDDQKKKDRNNIDEMPCPSSTPLEKNDGAKSDLLFQKKKKKGEKEKQEGDSPKPRSGAVSDEKKKEEGGRRNKKSGSPRSEGERLQSHSNDNGRGKVQVELESSDDDDDEEGLAGHENSGVGFRGSSGNNCFSLLSSSSSKKSLNAKKKIK